MRNVHVAPSDLAWLYDRCTRCWWKKTRKMYPIGDSLPKVFKAIDSAMKAGVTVERLRAKDVPVERKLDKSYVKSTPYEFSELGVSIVYAGYLDDAFALEDGTLAVIDYKATEPTDQTVAKYWRSLACYQSCLEHPQQGEPVEVSFLGLYCNTPESYREDDKTGHSALIGRTSLIELGIDRAKFADWTERLARVASLQYGPSPDPACERCKEHIEGSKFEASTLKRLLQEIERREQEVMAA